MKLKALLSRWIAAHIESRARHGRRVLRDLQRNEIERISEMEKRSRGLRLYAAWSVPNLVNVVQTEKADWHPAMQPAA